MNMFWRKFGVVAAIVCVAGSLAGCTYCAAVLATCIANHAANRIAGGLSSRCCESLPDNYCLQGEQV